MDVSEEARIILNKCLVSNEIMLEKLDDLEKKFNILASCINNLSKNPELDEKLLYINEIVMILTILQADYTFNQNSIPNSETETPQNCINEDQDPTRIFDQILTELEEIVVDSKYKCLCEIYKQSMIKLIIYLRLNGLLNALSDYDMKILVSENFNTKMSEMNANDYDEFFKFEKAICHLINKIPKNNITHCNTSNDCLCVMKYSAANDINFGVAICKLIHNRLTDNCHNKIDDVPVTPSIPNEDISAHSENLISNEDVSITSVHSQKLTSNDDIYSSCKCLSRINLDNNDGSKEFLCPCISNINLYIDYANVSSEEESDGTNKRHTSGAVSENSETFDCKCNSTIATSDSPEYESSDDRKPSSTRVETFDCKSDSAIAIPDSTDNITRKDSDYPHIFSMLFVWINKIYTSSTSVNEEIEDLNNISQDPAILDPHCFLSEPKFVKEETEEKISSDSSPPSFSSFVAPSKNDASDVSVENETSASSEMTNLSDFRVEPNKISKSNGLIIIKRISKNICFIKWDIPYSNALFGKKIRFNLNDRTVDFSFPSKHFIICSYSMVTEGKITLLL